MIRVTKEILEERDACKDGIDAFVKSFPNGLNLSGWTPLCQLIIIGHPELRKFWGWAVSNGLIPAWSLVRANLVRANLDGANLDGANLDGANLYGANLDGANLDGAYRPSNPPDGWWPDGNGYLRRKGTK
jgi:hypothetical protein